MYLNLKIFNFLNFYNLRAFFPVFSRGCSKSNLPVGIGLKEQLLEQAKDIEKERQPLFEELRQKEEEVRRINRCKKGFLKQHTVPLRELTQGKYTVEIAKRVATRSGTSFKLLIQGEHGNYTTWTNKYLTNIFEQLEQGDLVNKDGGFLS